MKMFAKFISIALTLALVFPSTIFAAGGCQTGFVSGVCNVTSDGSTPSCASADVQTAINAVANGDTVSIPAGSCTWTTTTASTPSVTNSNKEITIEGAGEALTIITDGTGRTVTAEVPLYMSGNNWTLKKLKFTGMTYTGSGLREPGLSANGTGWRVNHVTFEADPAGWNNGRGMSATGTGLIDYCNFIDTYQGLMVTGTGDTAWTEALTLGTENAVVIENNQFNYTVAFDGAMDAYGGARIVFRYNKIVNTVMGIHGFDTGGYRSPFSFEIYQNSFTKTASGNSVPINLRGGTGVVFGNTFTGNYWSINLVNYRTCTDYGSTTGKCTGLDSNDGNVTIDNVATYGAAGSGTATSDNAGGIVLTDSTKTWTADTLFTAITLTPTGTHTGADSATVLTKASGANWGANNYLIGTYLRNTTDGSGCVVTSNTLTTVTCALAGGSDNTWQSGDSFSLTKGHVALNTTTGASAQVYDNNGTTITTTPLVGGSRQTWLTGDAYRIVTGWPCKDQIGRTTDQASYPLHEWDNTLNGADADMGVNDFCSNGFMGSVHVVSGRDYFNDTVDEAYTQGDFPHSLNTEQTGWTLTSPDCVGDECLEQTDITAPAELVFVIPATSTSLTVPITTFTAYDLAGVTGYCLVESNDSAGCSWSGSAPVSYTFATAGSKILYAFAKDAAENISSSANDGVLITLPIGTITGGTISGGSRS